MENIYMDFNQRKPDYQYKNALRRIINEGHRTEAQSGIDTITYTGIQMRFPVKNGCPLITERNMAPERKKNPTIWRQAIGEICAFINGARTHEEISKFGCHWWKYFLTDEKCLKRGLEPGDNGPGSYGAAFHDFPTEDGVGCNQFENVMLQMKEKPHLKTHLISPWVPHHTYRHSRSDQKVVVCPCHGWLQFKIFDNNLVMHMTQRSGDFPIGVPSNMVQYFALLLAVARHLNLVPYEYVHYVIDAHIYVNQMEMIGEILGREPRVFPKLILNSDVENLFDLRHTDFEIDEYNPHGGIKMPVTV